MVEAPSFNMSMGSMYHPVMILTTPGKAPAKLFVDAKGVEGALLKLGDPGFIGPIEVKLATPYYGKGTFSTNRMESILLEVSGRHVSTLVITDAIETYTFPRNSFANDLRETLRKMKRTLN